jgi:hypothetical protein
MTWVHQVDHSWLNRVFLLLNFSVTNIAQNFIVLQILAHLPATRMQKFLCDWDLLGDVLRRIHLLTFFSVPLEYRVELLLDKLVAFSEFLYTLLENRATNAQPLFSQG